VAKLLFTSGSTDEPKAVINTQRMLCSNQRAILQVWPFLKEPPVLLDWLPWHHTFGGNHNFNLTLFNGGTLYIDRGRPVAGAFNETLENLRDVAPTVMFNVPRAYDFMVTALRDDRALRERFFSRLRLIFYAAAALPEHTWDALNALSTETLGRPVPLVSSWGLTETAPAATSCHYQATRTGVIGLPIPGCELKLVPSGDRLEARVRGPNVMPGYWKRPDLTAECFDEEGFFKTGDAVRFVDAERPELGLLFEGRLGENFKLTTATWVHVGALRLKAIAALAPVAHDIVITGHGRDEVGFLIVPQLDACRTLGGLPDDAAPADILGHARVRHCVAFGLRALALAGGGSSTYATRALLLEQPLSIDAGELTDKGYVNQRAVLTRRRALVDRLYTTPFDTSVITLPHPCETREGVCSS
jgi:feruloyl-CoA synthase